MQKLVKKLYKKDQVLLYKNTFSLYRDKVLHYKKLFSLFRDRAINIKK